ncbi:magnesium transporter [Lysinibacillus sp. NPDC096418]|uniref:magnesium transporter n=1 Tax=Lysinibacillus sp. NPDC096418 TaxID=3364138 RepID=UPI0038117095
MIEERNEKDEVLFDEAHLRETLAANDISAFRNEFLELHPYDQATFYEKVEPDIRKIIYTFLSPTEMADIFEAIELDDDEYEEFLNEMDTAYGAAMLSQMYADDAADVLNELDTEQRESYLEMMDDATADEINELLSYDEDTAGSIMTTEYVAIPENSTVRSAMAILRKEAPNAETIYYIFVVDEKHRLTGVISLRDLIIADEDTLIRSIMNERVVMVHAGDDQEEVAQIMKDYNFLAVPVIEDAGELLGIITVDDIIDVIDDEASEDYSKLAGISDMDKFDTSPWQAAKKRLPWLVILLFLGMLTANLMGQFEETLDKVALLAVFIPLISGTSGNSGTQALAVAIRGLATGDVEEHSKVKLLMREAGTGLMTGIVCGVIVVGIVYIWKHELILGMLVGAAICGSILVATLAGSFIPLLMHRLKIDPAVASGPFITTLNDITSILIYLGLATMFLSQIG